MTVVVTGIGLITALGGNAQEVWDNLCNGQSGISEVFSWDKALYNTSLAGVAKLFNPEDFFSKKQIRKLSYSHQLAIASAKMAVNDAKLQEINKEKVGIYLGTSLVGMSSGHSYHKQILLGKKGNPALAINYPMQVLLDKLTEEFGFLGARSIVSTACTASTIAIAQAVEAIRSGQLDCALVGGVDPLSQFSFAGFSSMQNMSAEACAPFSVPIGLNLGEGAGMMILESLSHANRRKARVYAEVAGYALGADAYHLTQPDSSALGLKKLLTRLLEDSAQEPKDIDYINAHGTATAGNDITEAKGIKLALGDYAKTIPVSSSKGAIGHTLGAAGAIEAIITVLSVYNNFIPPTANFKDVRSGCDLNHLKNKGIKKEVNVAITQNFAFGGNNVAILIRKPTNNIYVKKSATERCVITGFDLISSVGIGKELFLSSLKSKQSGISYLGDIIDNNKGGLIKKYEPEKLSQANLRRCDRIGSFTVCVTEMAFKDAKLSTTKEISEETGVIFGTESGPIETTRLFNEPIALEVPLKVNPALFPNTVLNAGIGLASIHLKLKGPNVILNVGEASGLRALSYGYDLIKAGISKRFICGGVDELSKFKLDTFALIKKFISRYSNNTKIKRTDVFLGEGASAFVLESLDVARTRGANIVAEIVGYSNTANSPKGDQTEEWTNGIFRSMKEAVENAKLLPKDIDFVFSGSLFSELDPFEMRAIELLFKRDMPIYNPSKYFGISAATAPIGLSACLLAMSGHLQFDLLADSLKAKKVSNDKVNTCLINSISMGNNNISLVIKRYVEDALC